MKITQHIPDFVEGGIPKEAEHETLEDILNISWVNEHTFRSDFVQFAKSSYKRDTTGVFEGPIILLMAEYKKFAWVVGYLDQDPDSLPVWNDLLGGK
jgi:hypothetical protein